MVDINELNEMSKSHIDLTDLDGIKTEIEKVEVVKKMTSYTEPAPGKPSVWQEGLQREITVLRVSTKVLKQVDSSKGKIDIRATEDFALKENNGKIGWSSHEKAKIQQLFRKLKVNKPTDLVGNTITTNLKVSKTGYHNLGFVM